VHSTTRYREAATGETLPGVVEGFDVV